MRILIINYEFPPLGGGGGVATYDLAVEWARTARVDVLTSSFRGLKRYENVKGINVYRVPVLFRKSRDAASFISMLSYLPAALIRGMFLARKNRYHVINTHFAVPSGPIGYLIGKMFRIPNVLSLHGGDIYDPSKKMSPHRSRFWRMIVRFILNNADRIVAQSSNTRDNALCYYNPDADISIIPLAFHPPAKPSVTRREAGIRDDEYVLLTIGRIVKRKNIDLTINALSHISNKNVSFYIIGDGPERAFLEGLVRSLGLVDRVKFLGFLDEEEKWKYLALADLFVQPSMHEGFGIIYMEAMHFGLPIVCTNHGGQVDFLTNKENALLIDVGDVDACADAVEQFMRDKELYRICSENNRKKIRGFYAEAIADRYMEIFKDLKNRDR